MDRTEIGNALAVAASLVAAAYTYFDGLGIIAILVSVVTGSLLTYAIQSRTQKSAWKREAALRKIDDIYGPLYNELNRISASLGKDGPQFFGVTFDPQKDPHWASIKPGFRYYLIEPDLRKELDNFFNLYSEYEAAKQKEWTIVEAKFIPRLQSAFGSDVEAATCVATAVQTNGQPVKLPADSLRNPVIRGLHPLEYLKQQYPGYSNYRLGVDLQRRGLSQLLFNASSPNEELEQRFDGVIAATIKDVAADPTVVWTMKTVADLKSLADILKEKLRKKIEEPWNV